MKLHEKVLSVTLASCLAWHTVKASAINTIHGRKPSPVVIPRSVSSSAETSHPTLVPAIHWDHDLTDIKNLLPQDSASLYYAERSGYYDISDPGSYAHMVTNFTYPTVVLEHTSYISSVTCSPAKRAPSNEDIRIVFNSMIAYNYSKSTWSAVQNLVLVTYTQGCGDATSKQHTFWHVLGVLWNDVKSACTVKAIELLIEDSMTDIDIVWGTYQPPVSSSSLLPSTSIRSGAPSAANTVAFSPGQSSRASTTYAGGAGTTAISTRTGIPVASQTSTSSNRVTTGPANTNGVAIPSSSSPPAGQTNSGGSGSGASSITTTRTAACGVPTSSIIDGFPAVACGENFDELLDDAIGYLDFTNDFVGSLQELAPGLDNYTESEYDDGIPLARRYNALQKRGALDRFKKFVKNVVTTVVDKAKELGSSVGTAVKTTVSTAISINPVVALKRLLTDDHNPTIEKEWNPVLAPTGLIASPFGQAKQIAQFSQNSGGASGSVTVYCVDCGIQAQIKVQGQAKINVAGGGILAGSLKLQGNAKAGLYVGLDAQVQYVQKFTEDLATFGLPGFTLHKVLTIGPVATLKAELDVNIQARGTLLVGVGMELPNFAMTIDLVNNENSVSSGFTPVFIEKFEATGEIDITVGLGLPLSIGVGVIAPIINIDKTIAIVEKPGVVANAKYSGSAGGAATGSTCPNGISYGLDLTNDVSLNFLGLKVIPLTKYTTNLATTCFTLAGSPTTTASTTLEVTTTEATTATETTATETTTETETATETTTTTETETESTTTTESPESTETSSETGTETTSSDSESTTEGPESTTEPATVDATTTEESTATETVESTTTAEPTTTSTLVVDEPVTTSESVVEASTTTEAAETTTTTEASTSGTRRKRNLAARQDDVNNPDDAEYEELNALALAAAQAEINDENDGLDTDYDYIVIADSKKQYQLIVGEDGNLYIDNFGADSTAFMTYQGVAVSDDEERILHYYDDTMARYGVSRIRLSVADRMPKTARVAALSPIDYEPGTPDDTTVFVVVDLLDGFFYPVLCLIDDQYSKLFLVKDVEEGTKMLESPLLQNTVTGGVTTDCGYLPFISTPY